jgi:ferritin-like metal-binding protein YciE
MERNVLEMLGSMIETTDDPEILRELAHHREETQRHEDSLTDCLEAHGEKPSQTLEIPALFGAIVKGFTDKTRGEKPTRNARDGYVTEHAEIAVYEILERIAQEAGDQKSAEVARRNRQDEESMARKIASSWDKAVKLGLQAEGIT